jgi:hypothetical protein
MTPMPDPDLAALILEARALGLSYVELARRTGRAIGTLQRWAYGGSPRHDLTRARETERALRRAIGIAKRRR